MLSSKDIILLCMTCKLINIYFYIYRGKKILKFSLVPWASKVKFLLVLLPNNLSKIYCQINLQFFTCPQDIE